MAWSKRIFSTGSPNRNKVTFDDQALLISIDFSNVLSYGNQNLRLGGYRSCRTNLGNLRMIINYRNIHIKRMKSFPKNIFMP